jgi:predicted permease
LTHNGIDIDQFILLTIYPTATFFLIGLFSRRFRLGEPLKYAVQAFGCIFFAIVYIVTIPNGGAQGLAVVLILFGGILFLMARKHIVYPTDGQENLSEKQS